MSWIAHVKAYAKKHKMKYGDAMKAAKASYKPKKKAAGQKGKGKAAAPCQSGEGRKRRAKAKPARAKAPVELPNHLPVKQHWQKADWNSAAH